MGHRMTLARKVIVKPEVGQQYTAGWSVVFPFCEICGVVVFDQRRHDEWHEQMEAPDGQ